MRSLAVLVYLVTAVWAQQVSYEGYKVYRVQPSNEDQVKTLAVLSKNEHFDFWSPLRFNKRPIDTMVHPLAQNNFTISLNQNGIKHEILIQNVESVIQEERVKQLLAPRLQQNQISFMQYHRHNEINAYLDKLAASRPQTVFVEVIGKSYEGRELKVIKVSKDFGVSKPIIFIDAGIHAREWIAPAQANYIINQLVENTTNSNLFEKVEWHILPVLNPDGYEYTHDHDRFWRKTRSKGQQCYGTDGNRNFDFHWGGPGTSSNECSPTYKGPEAFSEAETRALRDHILKHKDNIKLYLTLHSYGQYLLFPWGYTTALPDDHEELQALGERVADVIRSVAGTDYKVGTSTNTLSPGAGGSDDWVKAVAGVELSYTVELPSGGSGFDPPTNAIWPIVTETWFGIMEFHNYIEEKFGQRNVY